MNAIFTGKNRNLAGPMSNEGGIKSNFHSIFRLRKLQRQKFEAQLHLHRQDPKT
jgi:hypothetical protein